MSTFNRSKSINQRTLGVGTPRTASFGSPRVKLTSVSHWFRWLVVIGALFPFSIAIAGGYFYLLPSLTQAFQGFGTSKVNDSMEECNLFDGNWVFDESYPLYNASECPFAEQGFNCLGNGRRDEDYLRWRWKPKRCDIPRFNHVWMPRHVPRRVRSTLKLDKMDDISNQWVNSDILIFNTGHWWVPEKLFETGCYFQVANTVRLGMSIPVAFRIALDTWASWVEKMIDTNRTHVFFRTYEPSHWSEQSHRLCNMSDIPISEAGGKDRSVFSDTILEAVKNLTVPTTVLHITSMSALRSDAHVGKWNSNPSIPDCSHWCLPGVPDILKSVHLLPVKSAKPRLWSTSSSGVNCEARRIENICSSHQCSTDHPVPATPPNHPFHPPPPHHIPPPSPPHIIPPAPSHVIPPPPPTPGHHSTVIIVVFVSLGGLFFLAFLSVALCCFIKKKKNKTVQKTEILEFDEHTKVQEAIIPGPHGEKITVLNIEEDVHLVEEIKKNEKLAEGSHIKLAHDHPLDSDIATSSSRSNQQHLEHKV
ncbi:hypothetical protein D5086_010092 [Populus alba]|uniref:Uncharacterized protein n=1 Tax=Populus alba TaxID=43335 RepID=A0ACC4C8E2_POPAL